MECVELAPAFQPLHPHDSAGKPDALQTLRAASARKNLRGLRVSPAIALQGSFRLRTPAQPSPGLWPPSPIRWARGIIRGGEGDSFAICVFFCDKRALN